MKKLLCLLAGLCCLSATAQPIRLNNWVTNNSTAAITGLPTDAAPDSGADYVVTYDASTGLLKKVLLGNLPTAGGGEANSGLNLGIGYPVFQDKVGVNLRFNTWTNDATLTVSSNANTFTIGRAALTGDVTTSGNAATITANSVALSTDTTGNYVAGVSGTANEITVSHTPSEGSTATISLPAAIDMTGKVITGGTYSNATMVTPTLGVAGATTLDTGQGANELFDMDQNVLTSSLVQFGGLDINGNIDDVSGFIEQAEQSNPSTPGSGLGRWFVSTTGKPSFIDDAGTVSDLSSVAAAGSSQFVNGVNASPINLTNTPTFAWTLANGTNASGSVVANSIGGAQLTIDGTAESEIEAVVDLQDLQGAVTDAQVPNTITVDLATLATTATTANAGDSATAFFPSGTLEDARLSANVSLLGPSISESELSLTDITTGNASTLQHGFAPKGSGVAGQFYNSVGGWSVPTTSGADNSVTYYVSPAGAVTNSGLTENSPWTMPKAITNLAPGVTVLMMPGTYPGNYIIEPVSGTSTDPITIKSQVKWKAIIANSTNYGIALAFTPFVNYFVIDGLCVTNSANDGVGISGQNITVRNCWIVNNFGQGINSSQQTNANNIIEYNLVEGNGRTNDMHYHGIYTSGPGNIVRGNVVRNNDGGFGIHFYTEGSTNTRQHDNFIYNNLTYGHTNAYGVVMWNATDLGGLPGTNYFYNNTILDGFQISYGKIKVTNNIIFPSILAPTEPMIESGARPPTVSADYNLSPFALTTTGPHDIVTTNTGFVNAADGLYWLGATSAAKGTGAGHPLPYDFFGTPGYYISPDIGAFVYDILFTGDTRTLDPSPANPDYWRTTLESGSVLVELVNNSVTDAILRDSPGFSVIGKPDTGTGDPTNILLTADTVLGREGSGNVTAVKIKDAQIDASGIFTRSKLPQTLAYEDEANLFVMTNTFPEVVSTGAVRALSFIGSGTTAGKIELGDDDGSSLWRIIANGTMTANVHEIRPPAALSGIEYGVLTAVTNWAKAILAHPGSDGLLLTSTNTPTGGYIWSAAGAAPSDTAFASSWNGVTTISPSKNAVYDIFHIADTDDDGKVNVLDMAAGIVKTDSGGILSAASLGSDYLDSTYISDTAFASSWNGVTTISPSKNAVYDILHVGDPDDDGKPSVLDQGVGIAVTDSGGILQTPITTSALLVSAVSDLNSATRTATGLTYDAAGTGNVLKQTKHLFLTRPDYGDGAGAVPQTNTFTASGLMHFTFSGTAETNVNWVVYECVVPADIDTAVEMTATLAFVSGGTDADDVTFHLTYALGASGTALPTGTSIATSRIVITKTPTTPASGDVQVSAATTLTGWAASMTAGTPLLIRVARLNNTNDDTAREMYLDIAYASTQ